MMYKKFIISIIVLVVLAITLYIYVINNRKTPPQYTVTVTAGDVSIPDPVLVKYPTDFPKELQFSSSNVTGISYASLFEDKKVTRVYYTAKGRSDTLLASYIKILKENKWTVSANKNDISAGRLRATKGDMLVAITLMTTNTLSDVFGTIEYIK